MKVENNIIYYKTTTKKLTIIQPYNKVLCSKYVVLLKVHNYCVKNIAKALNSKDTEIKRLRSYNK